jgi:hypothetical protein
MFRRSQQGSSNTGRIGVTNNGHGRTSSKGYNAKNILHKKIFNPLWKRHKSKHYSSKGSVFSWDEASYECQRIEELAMPIDRIPTAIEYLSSSSNSHSLENENECMESQSRYSVPMEMDQQAEMDQNLSDQCDKKEDILVDKYSIIEESSENYDDDDDDKSTLFGSLENDSFTSDTALRDEINIEREKIKQSYMIANEESNSKKQSFFNVSACFGHINTNSRKYIPESPTKHAIRYELEYDQKFRLD